MRKRELERAVRAAARVARESQFLLVGSQVVHAYSRRPPAEVLLSQECDLYPQTRPETATLLTLELGRGSDFARRHGFYVDVVAPEVVTLPAGWRNRLTPIWVGPTRVLCLDLHDLVVSKLVAGRLKDLEFAAALLRLGLAQLVLVRRRAGRLEMKSDRERARLRLLAVMAELE